MLTIKYSRNKKFGTIKKFIFSAYFKELYNERCSLYILCFHVLPLVVKLMSYSLSFHCHRIGRDIIIIIVMMTCILIVVTIY